MKLAKLTAALVAAGLALPGIAADWIKHRLASQSSLVNRCKAKARKSTRASTARAFRNTSRN